MWDLLRPGHEPVSPASVPPGKPRPLSLDVRPRTLSLDHTAHPHGDLRAHPTDVDQQFFKPNTSLHLSSSPIANGTPSEHSLIHMPDTVLGAGTACQSLHPWTPNRHQVNKELFLYRCSRCWELAVQGTMGQVMQGLSLRGHGSTDRGPRGSQSLRARKSCEVRRPAGPGRTGRPCDHIDCKPS